MLLPPTWTAADNVKVSVFLPPPPNNCDCCVTPILKNMLWLDNKIHKNIYMYVSMIEWKHESITRCSWSKVIMQNTNETLNFFKNESNLNKELCTICRGKGHPWTCEIWNGRPYNGHPKTRQEWDNPVKCKKCNGTRAEG